MGKDNPLDQVPPDDSGSSTFNRFRFQAKVAFPYLLNCAVGGSEVAIIPEHFEDLLLEYEDSWRFIQIKTREADQGLWTLKRIAGTDEAPLRSLFRTYVNTKDLDAKYEAFLEHALANDVRQLRKQEGRNDKALVEKIAEELGADANECAAFLKKVRITDNLPPRAHIDNENLILLQSHASDLNLTDAKEIYRKCLNQIEDAMELGPSDGFWPHIMEDEEEAKKQFKDKKRLDRSLCKDLVGQLASTPNTLLSRILDPEEPRPTALEVKLLAGGASPETIVNAKLLRARADHLEYQIRSSQTIDPRYVDGSSHKGLEDVRSRLLIKHQALLTNATGPHPATSIWSDLLSALNANPSQFDPNSLFNQDGFLLLGEICQLSDECLAQWR